MSTHQLLASAAQYAPHAVAMKYQGCTVTWMGLNDRVARRAAHLRTHVTQPGARVALLAANLPEHMEAAFAVMWAGLVLVPVNTRLSLAEQAYILAHCDCQHLYHDERFAERAAQLAAQVPSVATSLLTPMAKWGTPGDGPAQVEPMPFTPLEPSSTAAIFYTGGTTGMPKGAQLSHICLMIQGLSAQATYKFDQSTGYLHSTPMFHLADFSASLGAVAGASCHSFLPDFTPAAVLDAVENEGVNSLPLVPTMVAAMLEESPKRPETFRRLRNILYGAAPIAEPVLRRLLQQAPDVNLFQIYGQTELGGACTALPPNYHVLEGPLAGKLGSAGRVVPSFLMRIVDEEGQPLPNGERGEVCVCGPAVMNGYWNDPELTAKTVRNGWLHTGDMGILDDEGFVTIVGRLKDMIISGGENVFAGEVESALAYHDAVAAVAVIGVPDERWGEAVHAVVVLKPGRSATQDELIAHCRERIAHYKCPRSITFRDNPLPLSGVGKVRKVDLQREWKEQHHMEIKQ